ncbi:MAG: LacI family DNA-binding transcriptional regulator [Novosphingobium sp.]
MASRSSRPSAHDVARLAGVSQAAVSRAFTPGAVISKATREKVIVAAQQIGYRPNLLARSLIKGSSGIIGVVIGNPQNATFVDALAALSARMSSAGRHVMVFTGESNASADLHVEDLLKYRVDGLVLMWTSISAKSAEECRREGIPVVFLNRRSIVEGFSCVSGANYEGCRQIAQHLIDQGYRKIGFISGREDSVTNREREAAFTAQLLSAGMPPPERVVGHFERQAGMAAARELLSGKSRPDAIFCANDVMALGAIEVARSEFGLKVGREVGIAGFDDIEMSDWPSFQLTTYSQPIQQLVDVVSDILLDPERAAAAETKVVSGELKIRASTRRT